MQLLWLWILYGLFGQISNVCDNKPDRSGCRTVGCRHERIFFYTHLIGHCESSSCWARLCLGYSVSPLDETSILNNSDCCALCIFTQTLSLTLWELHSDQNIIKITARKSVAASAKRRSLALNIENLSHLMWNGPRVSCTSESTWPRYIIGDTFHLYLPE